MYYPCSSSLLLNNDEMSANCNSASTSSGGLRHLSEWWQSYPFFLLKYKPHGLVHAELVRNVVVVQL